MARVLIIEDDPNAREMLRFRLKKSGFEIREATDGDEGILLAQRMPDLILLDVRLPKIDGWEVCRQLKSNPKTKVIPIIMLTGCSQPVQATYGKECGADAYVVKPWDAAQLLKIAHELILSNCRNQKPLS